MKRTFLVLLIFISSDIYSQDINASTNSVLFYNQTIFDSDTCCWRKLIGDKKYLEAADLIVAYLKTLIRLNENWGKSYGHAYEN